MHYYQPLNEDIIDVLQDEQDEELEKSTSEVVKGDDTQSPDDFKYAFKFYISSIPKDKKEAWYLEKMENARDIFLNILQISRNIEDSQMYDVAYTAYPYNTKNLMKQISDNGVVVQFSGEYFDNAYDALRGYSPLKKCHTNNDVTMTIGITADFSTFKNMRLVLMDLCRAFKTAVYKSYRTQGRAASIDLIIIDPDSKRAVTVSPDDITKLQQPDEKFGRYMQKWFRVFNPEYMPKKIAQLYAEFLENDIEGKLPDYVKDALHFYYLPQDSYKVEYDDDGIYVQMQAN